MVCFDRTDGFDQLHWAVRYRDVPVLWHWYGLGDNSWTTTDRNYSDGRIPFSNGIQCRVDVRFQVRPIGMGLADADLWQMAWDKKIIPIMICAVNNSNFSQDISSLSHKC